MKRLLILTAIALLVAANARAAVAFDAKMTAGNGSGGTYAEASSTTTISSTGMTVGSSATLLVVPLACYTNGATLSSLAATWNSVSMSLGPTLQVNTQIAVALFYLVNPATGNKTLAASWTGTANACYMSATSFTGTDTTTGIKTSDNVTASNASSITVASDANGATVAVYVNDTTQTGAPNFTVIFGAIDLKPNGYANYHLGGTSNVHTFAGATPDTALAGVHVISGGGAAAPKGVNKKKKLETLGAFHPVRAPASTGAAMAQNPRDTVQQTLPAFR